MDNWSSKLNLSWPYWDDYRQLLQQLAGPEFPTAGELCRMLPAGIESHGGQPVRFIPAGDIPGVAYEDHIFSTGRVSTRPDSWHDLFNAMVWCRFPRLKAAMNAVHFEQQKTRQSPARGVRGARGKMRDALTLLDESGAIVVGSDRESLQAMAEHDWPRVFGSGTSSQPNSDEPDKLDLFLCGHALLEKFLDPYKAITAKVLLVQVEEHSKLLSRNDFIARLDHRLADRLLDGNLFSHPADLSPLPLMGVPGWWPEQDSAFYSDRGVFRPRRENSNPAPVFEISIDPGHDHNPRNGTQ